jgi:hypothetical protein
MQRGAAAGVDRRRWRRFERAGVESVVGEEGAVACIRVAKALGRLSESFGPVQF